jgi:hypothetical protein
VRVPLPVVVGVPADSQGDRGQLALPQQKREPIFFKNQQRKMSPFLSQRSEKNPQPADFFSILGDLIAIAASSIFFGRKCRRLKKNRSDGYFFGVVPIFCGASLPCPETPDGLAPPMAPFLGGTDATRPGPRRQRGRQAGRGEGEGRKEPQRPPNGRRKKI